MERIANVCGASSAVFKVREYSMGFAPRFYGFDSGDLIPRGLLMMSDVFRDFGDLTCAIGAVGFVGARSWPETWAVLMYIVMSRELVMKRRCWSFARNSSGLSD